MLKKINIDDEATRGATQHPQKHCYQPKDLVRGKLASNENNENVQLKQAFIIQRKKAENIGTSLRETYAIYSKVHAVCLTKFHTLFMAFHLYELAIANPSLKNVPQAYKSLCCMFLAMKYEEIYPVQLTELAKYLKVTFNLDDYCRYEKALLVSLGFDLDVQTIDRMLEAQFAEFKYTNVEEIICYYLLELTFSSQKIYKQFGQIEICRAITKLVKKQGLSAKAQSKEDMITNQVMKLILEARNSDKGLEKHIIQKYQSKKYDSVASLQL